MGNVDVALSERGNTKLGADAKLGAGAKLGADAKLSVDAPVAASLLCSFRPSGVNLLDDTEPTLVVTFDTAKYIFNVGENTHRAFLQSRYNWKKAKALFVTQSGTQRAGGLPGLMMTFVDGGLSSLDVVGPTGILHQLASMRMYMFRDTVHVRPIEAQLIASPEPLYKDENITVYGVPVLPSTTEQPMQNLLYPGDVPLKRKRSPSLDQPSKRVAVASHDHSMSTPNFYPPGPSSSLAQEWRSSMVKIMFPENKRHENVIAREKKEESRLARTLGEEKPTSQANASESEINAPKPEANSSDNIDTYRRARVPHGFYQQLPAFSYSGAGSPDAPPTLGYVVMGPRIRGKFDAKKAQELGIPNGPIRRRLISGETVTFKTMIQKVEGDASSMVEVERTVRPEECVGESESPSVILILDIPSPAHISSLLSSFDDPFFAKFKSRNQKIKQEHVVRSVFHILGEGVLEDERYVQFMKSFEEDDDAVHHLIASREHCSDPVTFTSAAFNQLRLNQLDERMFTIPKICLQPAKDISTIPNLPRSTHLMRSNHTVSMRPFKFPIVETPVQDNFHLSMKANEPAHLPPWTAKKFRAAKKSVANALKKSKRRSRSTSNDKSSSESESGSVPLPKRGKDVGVLPLGTASCMPTKYRNVSSTLLSIPGWGNVLLDAGEGTWGQLVRQYGLGQGPSEPVEGTCRDVWQMLRDLKCIFISHIHADHHLGVATILAKRKALDPPPKNPLYLVTTRAVHLYLRELQELQNLGIATEHDVIGNEEPNLGSGVVPIMSEALHWKQQDAYPTSGMWQVGGAEPWLDLQRSRRLAVGMCQLLGMESFQTVDMFHRTRCYGVVMKHQDDWGIAFSGDTIPVNALAWAGKNATLLIHEATMADDQEELALKKAHSTIGQAVAVGKKMNAEHILLTHFSARYPKMPPTAAGTAKPDSDPMIFAHSGMGYDAHERAQTPEAVVRRRDPVIATAFDHMNLTIGDMWKVNHYLPAIHQSFLDTREEGDDEVDESGAMEVT
ncbi:hypothetical protein APHAL10511_005274 [Amanita phalloides]|nr:hypothetical protein APHAL10511_005274 [Amanita phalloides]